MSRPLRSTGDLLVALAWTLAAGAAVLTGLPPGTVRTVLAVPLVVLLPGYSLVSALFPEDLGTDTAGEDETMSLTGVERFGLSVVLSIVLVPMVGFVVNYTYGFFLRPLLLAVCGLTVFLALVGILRRLALPAERRHTVSPGAWFDETTGSFLSVARRDLRVSPALKPSTGGQQLLNVLFVVSLLTLAATAGYATVTPPRDDDPFSEFYLLTQDENGEFVAEDLPTEFAAGESREVYVAIGNHEGQRVPYTVVMTLDGREIDRFSTTIGAGQTERVRATVSPQQTGDRLRLSFLLYRGDVPENPTPENAYRESRLWISVGGS